MVYLSTRIKRSAAQAFEREEIETDEFSISKPDGFLHPLNTDSGLAFEAYTREFGEDDARKMRQAMAELEVHEGGSAVRIRADIKKAAGKVLSEQTIREGEREAYLIDTERLEKGVPVTTLYKISGAGSKVYEMRISVLDEFKESYLQKSEELRAGFRLK